MTDAPDEKLMADIWHAVGIDLLNRGKAILKEGEGDPWPLMKAAEDYFQKAESVRAALWRAGR